MDQPPSLELLESLHSFPGPYQIKAIGITDDDFEIRVLDAVRSQLANPDELQYTVRATPAGRHVSLTLHIQAQTADEVRQVYDRIKELKGLHLLL